MKHCNKFEPCNKFEHCNIGNEWGNFVDIENFKYDLNSMRSLPLVKKKTNPFNNNKNNNEYDDKIIIKNIKIGRAHV
jgi:hypothetical protein